MELTVIIILAFVIYAFIKISRKYSDNNRGDKEEQSRKHRQDIEDRFEQKRQVEEAKRSSPHPCSTPSGSVLPTERNSIQDRLNELSKFPHNSTKEKGKFLFLDTETTGLPRKRNAVPEEFSNWPYIVEIAWLLVDEEGLQVSGGHYIVKQNVSIPKAASDIHNITTDKMLSEGIEPKEVYAEFIESVDNTEYVIAHNLEFDMPIIECELLRNGFNKVLFAKKCFCTMKGGRDFCTVYDRNGHIKNPKLSELFGELYFNMPHLAFEGLHNALSDTLMLYRCFMKMKEKKSDLLCECFDDDKPSIDILKEHIDIIQEQSPADEVNIPMISNEQLKEYFDEDAFKGVQVLVTGVAQEDKEECWEIIENLNGKVVKSVTKNLAVVVFGPTPGWKKIEDIKLKLQSGSKIIGITDIQLNILYEKLRR